MVKLHLKIQRYFYLILPVILFFGCTTEDADDTKCYSGIVQNEISCHSENGFIFLVKINNHSFLDTLATTVLPKVFQKVGTKIYFRIKEQESAIFCTTDIIPPKNVFEIYDVSNESCLNK
jgi:hypothetical protein